MMQKLGDTIEEAAAVRHHFGEALNLYPWDISRCSAAGQDSLASKSIVDRMNFINFLTFIIPNAILTNRIDEYLVV
jgi:hypothetical protein